MDKKWRITLLLKSIFMLTALILFTSKAGADFDDQGAGARAIGMGNSFTALADDVFGIYYNPAGLGFLRVPQAGADFGKLYIGLDDGSDLVSGFTAAVFPLFKITGSSKIVVISSSAVSMNALTIVPAASTSTIVSTSTSTTVSAQTAIKISSETEKTTFRIHRGTFALGLKYFSLMNYYQESAYYLSFGYPVSDKLACGINVKYLQEKYVIDDYLKLSPVFDYGLKDSVSNVSFDAGVLYNIAPNFFAGVSALDINQPNLGLLETDQLPYTVRAGLAWKESNISWAADAVYRNKQIYYSSGFERFIKKYFGVRMGLAYGGKNYFDIAGGFSVNFFRVRLDYVFLYPVSGIKDISGTHRMSLVFRYGRKEKDEIEIGSIEYYYDKLKEDYENINHQLAETKGEKENLEKVLLEEATMRIKERIKSAKAEARGERQPAAEVKSVKETKEVKESRHTVKKGDTLQSIAEKYYGDSKYWDEIYKANKENVGRGGELKVDQVLIIPPLTRSEISAPQASHDITPVKIVVPSGPVQKTLPDIVPIKIVPIKIEDASQSKTLENENIEKSKEAVKEKPRKAIKHIVQKGENLRSIAQKYYNDSSRWKEIYKANKDKITGGQITPGQEIIVP